MDKITLPMSVKQVGDDEDYFMIEGYLAAYGNNDFGGDRIEQGAFADFLSSATSKGQESVPALWSHNHSSPIGVMPIKDMREDNKGLFIKALFPKDDDFVKGRVMPQVRVGSVRQMSIGYDAIEWEMEEDYIRVLKKLYLFEGSLTPLPMNDQATITAFKSAQHEIHIADLKAKDIRELEQTLRSGTRFSAKAAMALISAIKSAGLRDAAPVDNRDGNDSDDDEGNLINTKLDEILNLF